jgi:hypothetical protein
MKVLGELMPVVQKVIEGFIPRKFDNDWLVEMCGKPSYENDPQTLTKVISEPIWDILDRGTSTADELLSLLEHFSSSLLARFILFSPIFLFYFYFLNFFLAQTLKTCLVEQVASGGGLLSFSSLLKLLANLTTW